VIEVDLAHRSVRALNERLHQLIPQTNELHWRVLNPNGAHAVAVGITQPVQVEIRGHVGYYCAGMNKAATVVVDGHAGTGLAENIMSGLVRVRGNASQSVAASGCGGLVVIEGDASARLWHLDEGRRYRRWRFGRAYDRVHGPSR
jgi:methylamine---glutamate N-methyltransferase subunit B